MAERDTRVADERTAIWKQRILSSSCLYPRNSLPFSPRVVYTYAYIHTYTCTYARARAHIPFISPLLQPGEDQVRCDPPQLRHPWFAKMAAVARTPEDLPLPPFLKNISNFSKKFLVRERKNVLQVFWNEKEDKRDWKKRK